VNLSYDPFSSSHVAAQDCVGDNLPIVADAVSLFVGTPSGGKAAHYTGVPFSVSGNTTLNLGVDTADAFCFFTRIAGGFRGSGESVRLYTQFDASSQTNLWYAKTTRGSGGNQINAQGRCFFYHQVDL